MRTSARPCGIDANVIVRYLVQDDQNLSAKATQIMEAVGDGKITVSCDPVVLAEVVWVLTSFYKLERRRIGEGLEPILASSNFLVPNKDRYIRALRLYSESSSVHFGDACACADALDGSEGCLFSFDLDLSNVDGVCRAECLADL